MFENTVGISEAHPSPLALSTLGDREAVQPVALLKCEQRSRKSSYQDGSYALSGERRSLGDQRHVVDAHLGARRSIDGEADPRRVIAVHIERLHERRRSS